eukprot:1152015-Pelagomonas_calceolata.AAC.11
MSGQKCPTRPSTRSSPHQPSPASRNLSAALPSSAAKAGESTCKQGQQRGMLGSGERSSRLKQGRGWKRTSRHGHEGARAPAELMHSCGNNQPVVCGPAQCKLGIPAHHKPSPTSPHSFDPHTLSFDATTCGVLLISFHATFRCLTQGALEDWKWNVLARSFTIAKRAVIPV